MRIYQGILDKIDLRRIGLKDVLDKTIENTRKLLEEGYKQTTGQDTGIVMHLSLLDRNGQFYCLSSSFHDSFALATKGVDYLRNEYRFRDREKGLIWVLIGDDIPRWLGEYGEVLFVNKFDEPEVNRRTINLVLVPRGYNLVSVLFSRIRVKDSVVGALAADFYLEGESKDMKPGIHQYTVFFDALSSIISLVIEGLHMAYYDPKLNRKQMRGIFGPAYLDVIVR